MTAKEIDSIVSKLDSIRQNKKHIEIARAQAEIDCINRCAVAYFDGLYDMAKEIKNLLPAEADNG